MERKVGGVREYSNEPLGVERQEIPLHWRFFREGAEVPIERNGVSGYQVGYAGPTNEKDVVPTVICIFDGVLTQVAESGVIYDGTGTKTKKRT